MAGFEMILTRADVPTLERLIGGPAVKLLKILDSDLIRGEPLRKILTKMKPPTELLLEPASWAEVVDLLNDSEAAELASYCGIDVAGDPWKSLKEFRLRRRSKYRDVVYNFFELPIPEPPNQGTPPSKTEAHPTHSLFRHQRSARRRVAEKLRVDDRRVVLHMPTGAGKTRTAMRIVADHLLAKEPTLVIWLAYSEELCEQAACEFETAWRSVGDRPAEVVRFWGKHDEDLHSCEDGLIVAGLGKMYSRAIAEIQFIARLADRVSLIVIDEAHQAIADSYSLILDTLHSKHRETALLGLTATPGRSWDDLDEDRRLADFFSNQKVTLSVERYKNPLEYLIDEGYLARPMFRNLFSEAGATLSDADLRSIERELDVPTRVLQRLGEDEQRNLRILTEVERLADSHLRILVFAPSVESAKLLSTALEAHGRVESYAVTGATPSLERQRIIRWYRAPTDSPRVLCNYGVLTAGFDAPKTSAAVIARPTKSLVLYSQMVGRAIRGEKANGNRTAEIVTIVDTQLPGFGDLAESFVNWEDAGWENPTT